jgi:hypothetical protein
MKIYKKFEGTESEQTSRRMSPFLHRSIVYPRLKAIFAIIRVFGAEVHVVLSTCTDRLSLRVYARLRPGKRQDISSTIRCSRWKLDP